MCRVCDSFCIDEIPCQSILLIIFSVTYDFVRNGLAPWGNPMSYGKINKCIPPRTVNSIKTHLPVDKMAAISLTMFPDSFSWMKSIIFWLKFHWRLFLMAKLTNNCIGLDIGLAPNRRQAIVWTNADQIHWCIYAALGRRWVNHINEAR